MSWLAELEQALATSRVPAARRRRIVAELDDHLRCDPSAAERLGDPAELAARFADEVGTALSLRAAFGVFLALAPFGLLFVALVAALGPARFSGSHPNFVGPPVIVGVQLAFVGGMLALLRAWRLRREKTLPAAQATILLRRSALGLGGGMLTLAGIVVGATHVPGDVVSWFAPLMDATVAVGAVTLAGAAAAIARAARLRPLAAGAAAGDLESDLGPFLPPRLRGLGPWRLALRVAALVALGVAVAGVVQSDPFDGLARAVLDGTACLAGFALLGRWLGLR